MLKQVMLDGTLADIGFLPITSTGIGWDNWYRSSEAIAGYSPYGGHVANKKWPMTKVFKNLSIMYFIFFNLDL